jgi:FixJ family two-component response regulator
MPGMSGPEFINKLQNVWKGIKVLYISGYTPEAVRRNEMITGQAPYLQKPFRALDFASKVRAVLDGDEKKSG